MPSLNLCQSHHTIIGAILRKPWLQIRHRHLEFFARRQNHSPFDYVLQLANISGPWIADKSIHRLGGNRVDLLLRQTNEMLGEVPDKERDIFGSFPQRRNIDGENIQPVEEIGTEFLIVDQYM